MIERILSIIATIIAGALAWVAGVYIRRRVLEKRNMRIYLNKEEWHDDMDMIPTMDHDQQEGSSKAAIRPKPPGTPMSPTEFFDHAHQIRSQQKNSAHHIIVHKKVYNNNTRKGEVNADNNENYQ